MDTKLWQGRTGRHLCSLVTPMQLALLSRLSVTEFGHGNQVIQRALKFVLVKYRPSGGPLVQLCTNQWSWRGTRPKASDLNHRNTTTNPSHRPPCSPGALLALFDYPSVFRYHKLDRACYHLYCGHIRYM